MSGRLGDCSSEDDGPEELANIKTADKIHFREQNEDGNEVWKAALRNVKHKNLQLFDFMLKSVDFILTEHCCLVHLTPEYKVGDGD